MPDSSKVEYSYNATNLISVHREKENHQFHWDYSYFLSGKLAKVCLPNHLGNINYTYDCCLRPIRLDSPYLTQNVPEEGYDKSGNLVNVAQKDAAGEITSTYKYDSLQHLVEESGIADHIYQFDSLHNRIEKDGILNRVNTLNQLTQQGSKSYEYDLNGNQSNRKDHACEAQYQYDALDRLIAVTFEAKKIEYVYDSFHRRLKKICFELQEDKWKETDTQTYLYLGDREIGVINTAGQMSELRTLGLGGIGDTGMTILMELDKQILCPIHDFRGNIIAVVDAASHITIECYRFTAFGEEQVFDGKGNRKETAISPWRFSSKRVDPETGWIFFGRRYYDPEIGKWTTPDPIGFKDGRNVYCFVRNNPMMFIDPDGRVTVPSGPAINSIDKMAHHLKNNRFEVHSNCFISTCMKIYDNEYEGSFMPYEEYSEVITVGTRQNNGLGFMGVNGICNTRADAIKAAKNLSAIAKGNEVQFVYNASHGIFLDVVECALGLAGVETFPVSLVLDTFNELSDRGVNKTLLTGHSQGGIISRLAAYKQDQDKMRDILFLGIASAAHMPLGLFGDAVHYESKRDIVPMFDICSTLWNGSAHIEKLDPHPDAPGWDHPCDSPTFTEALENTTRNFMNAYGGN